MIINGQTIFSKQYQRVKRRISFAVTLNSADSRNLRFGLVESFVVMEGVAIALVIQLRLATNQLNEYFDTEILEKYIVCDIISHIFKVDVDNSTLVANDASEIFEVVFMRIPSQSCFDCYVSTDPVALI